MTALTNPTNTAVGAGFNPFAEAGAGAGSFIYIKFKGASGAFLKGQDEEEIDHGTQFGADIYNTEWHWAFWWDGEVLETIKTKVIEDPMAYDKEPDYLPEGYDGDMSLEEIREEQKDKNSNFMDGWSCQAVMNMRGIDDGEEYQIKLNQGVALNAFRSLLQAYGRQFAFKEGLTPIISLDARSYKSKSKSVGKRFSPLLKIEDWKSESDLMAMVGDDGADYGDDDDYIPEDDAPAPKQIAAPAADEDEAPKPRGRGRGKRNYA